MDVRWGEQKEVDRKRRKTIDDIMVAGGRELIDTLWNVNVTDATAINKMETELIDTLWNVNTNQICLTLPPFGINRYIMECKFIYDSISLWIFRELIDTLWNVNDFG